MFDFSRIQNLMGQYSGPGILNNQNVPTQQHQWGGQQMWPQQSAYTQSPYTMPGPVPMNQGSMQNYMQPFQDMRQMWQDDPSQSYRPGGGGGPDSGQSSLDALRAMIEQAYAQRTPYIGGPAPGYDPIVDGPQWAYDSWLHDSRS